MEATMFSTSSLILLGLAIPLIVFWKMKKQDKEEEMDDNRKS